MTDPTTLSLADLAAAVVRLGAHRGDDTLVIGNAGGPGWIWEDLDSNACSLLLAAANRLPGVVAECERLRGLLDRAASMLEANTDKSSRRFVAAAIRKEAAGE